MSELPDEIRQQHQQPGVADVGTELKLEGHSKKIRQKENRIQNPQQPQLERRRADCLDAQMADDLPAENKDQQIDGERDVMDRLKVGEVSQ